MMHRSTFSLCLTLLLAIMVWGSQVYAQCPNCTIVLPPMPKDTVYLDTVPNGHKGVYYEENLSFRLPYTTTPLTALDPSIPSGITLQGFRIMGITGLPLGMTYKMDRPMPAYYNETDPVTRDGCITLCGTPLQSDSFTVLISMMVETGVLAPQAAVIPLKFYVHPDSSAGFTASNTNGCAPLVTSVTNNVFPNATFGQTATYNWNFGNGQTSTDQNPTPVTYSDSGAYTITYQAIVLTTTPNVYLTQVRVNAASCGDFFGDPEIFITVTGSQSGIDTITGGGPSNVPSSPIPVTFNFGRKIKLVKGSRYTVKVEEDDSPFASFPQIEQCGSVNFSADTTANQFSLTSGPLTVRLTLERDTTYSRDTTSSSEIVVVQNCTSIKEIESIAHTFFVYPNPTSGLVQVQFETPEIHNEEVQIMISDMLGRKVAHKQLGNFVGAYNEGFDLGQYGTGVYLMQLQIGNNLMYKKVIVR